ncbi:MAG TPA: mechanosensitive ion channel family protein [Dermatophilaceae bacterium]|nr:mechanosensitive ion channel family protein [Dermatophilaceae bacterium]
MQALAGLSWLTSDELWSWVSSRGLLITVTVTGAVALRWLVHRTIDRVVRRTLDRATARAAQQEQGGSRRASRVLAEAAGIAHERHRQRTATTGALLKSTATFALAVLAVLTVMATIGLPLAPLLASAGVGGVALGFGAQSLVKDFLSGIFMILEDQYGVGDWVDTGEAIGVVEDVSLRVTRLRDGNGVVWYIRNGEIVRIGNRSQGWSTALVDLQVAYDQDLDKAVGALREVVAEMDRDPAWADRLLAEPEVAGIEAITAGAVTLRVVAKCAPNENIPVTREILERAKVAFDRAGIRAPALPLPYAARPGLP